MAFRKIAGLFAVILFIAALVKAQETPKQILERTWYGQSVQDVDFGKERKAFLRNIVTLELHDYNTLTGITTTTVKIDGKTYTSVSQTSGRFYPETFSITLNDDKRLKFDKLPGNLQWCKGLGTLQIYDKTEGATDYLMMGTIVDECGGTSEVQWTDRKFDE